MKIDRFSYGSRRNIWPPKFEASLALFIDELAIIRPEINKKQVAKEILEKYVRLSKNGKVNATPLMRDIMSE